MASLYLNCSLDQASKKTGNPVLGPHCITNSQASLKSLTSTADFADLYESDTNAGKAGVLIDGYKSLLESLTASLSLAEKLEEIFRILSQVAHFHLNIGSSSRSTGHSAIPSHGFRCPLDD